MTRSELIDYCLTYPDAYEDYPFDSGPDAADSAAVIRHRLNKRIFALIMVRDGLSINLKCEPLRADFLRGMYKGVTPGYHMNKLHWNTVLVDSDVPIEELYAMIDHSYKLTMPKAVKKLPESL